MTPTVVAVGLGSDVVVHGVVGEEDGVTADSGVDKMVTKSVGGQADAGTTGGMGGVSKPAAIFEAVDWQPTRMVNDNGTTHARRYGLIVEGGNSGLEVLLSVEVMECGCDIVADVDTIVLDKGVPSRIELHAFGYETIVALDILVSILSHTVGATADKADIIYKPPIAVVLTLDA